MQLYRLPSEDFSCNPELYNDINTVAPANSGLLLRGEPGSTVKLVRTQKHAAIEDGPYFEHNMLVAVTEPTHVEPTNGIYINFMLSQGKFIRIAASDESVRMPANKAYLQIPTEVLTHVDPARGIALHWDDGTTTDISTNQLEATTTSHYYDLQGRRVDIDRRAIRGNHRHQIVIERDGDNSRKTMK